MQRKDQAPWAFLSADFEESKSEEIELAVRLEREKEEELEDLKQRLGPPKKHEPENNSWWSYFSNHRWQYGDIIWYNQILTYIYIYILRE